MGTGALWPLRTFTALGKLRKKRRYKGPVPFFSERSKRKGTGRSVENHGLRRRRCTTQPRVAPAHPGKRRSHHDLPRRGCTSGEIASVQPLRGRGTPAHIRSQGALARPWAVLYNAFGVQRRFSTEQDRTSKITQKQRSCPLSLRTSKSSRVAATHWRRACASVRTSASSLCKSSLTALGTSLSA